MDVMESLEIWWELNTPTVGFLQQWFLLPQAVCGDELVAIRSSVIFLCRQTSGTSLQFWAKLELNRGGCSVHGSAVSSLIYRVKI